MGTPVSWLFCKRWPLTLHRVFKFSRILQRPCWFLQKYSVQHENYILCAQHVSLYCAHSINKETESKTVVLNADQGEQQFSLKNPKHIQEMQENSLLDIIKENRVLSDSDWDNIRNSVFSMGSAINQRNIDGLIMRSCVLLHSFKCGKSYMKYLSTGDSTPYNLSVIKNFFRLCYVCRSSCTDEDLSYIDQMYTYVNNNYSILDANTAECIVMGLSVTRNWRNYQKYFEIIKETCTPSPSVYSAVIEAAFLNNDFELGWQLMEEMIVCNKNPEDKIYETWLQVTKNQSHTSSLERLFKYLATYDIKLTKSVAVKIKEVFDKNVGKQKRGSAFTSITTR